MTIVTYFVTDPDGTVTSSGTCQEHLLEFHANSGTLHKGEAPKGLFRYVGGKFEPIVVPVTYVEQRAAEYPPIKDQLDALWHAMDQGTLPKAEPFYSSIKTVKETYPKS